MISNDDFHVHLAFPQLEDELRVELLQKGSILEKQDRIFITSPIKEKLIWSQCSWTSPRWIPITSINDGINQLKKIYPIWMGYSFHNHRRSELIQKPLLRTSPKPLSFLGAVPKKSFGAWTLWKENLILASEQTSSSLPLGQAIFLEDKKIPSRAYLKLWELFTLHEPPPSPTSKVIDLGSSPGGWTWVLDDLRCQVISVDKAPLDERLRGKDSIQILKKDAFQLSPNEIGPVDYLFSDIICEPDRLLSLVEKWLASGLCQKMICTIKFKGKTDFNIIDKFQAISGSRLLHLCANKHELTWVYRAP